ncbi:CBU_0592 family membrane protein [Aromatoleum toluolicum]
MADSGTVWSPKKPVTISSITFRRQGAVWPVVTFNGDLPEARMNIPDLVGLIGVAGCLAAYAGLQLGRFQQYDLPYLVLNIVSPACLLFSLYHNFNLSAVITQVLWLGLTVIAWVKAVRRRERKIGAAAPDCVKSQT